MSQALSGRLHKNATFSFPYRPSVYDARAGKPPIKYGSGVICATDDSGKNGLAVINFPTGEVYNGVLTKTESNVDKPSYNEFHGSAVCDGQTLDINLIYDDALKVGYARLQGEKKLKTLKAAPKSVLYHCDNNANSTFGWINGNKDKAFSHMNIYASVKAR